MHTADQSSIRFDLKLLLARVRPRLPTADGYGLPASPAAGLAELGSLLAMLEPHERRGRAELLSIRADLLTAAGSGDAAAANREADEAALLSLAKDQHDLWAMRRWRELVAAEDGAAWEDAEAALTALGSRLDPALAEQRTAAGEAYRGRALVRQLRALDTPDGSDRGRALLELAAADAEAMWPLLGASPTVEARVERSRLLRLRDDWGAAPTATASPPDVPDAPDVSRPEPRPAAARRDADTLNGTDDSDASRRAQQCPPELIEVAPATLRERHRRLLDPDRPLAEPERFVFGYIETMVGSLLLAALCGLLGTLFARTAITSEGAGRIAHGVAAAALLAYAVHRARKLVRALRQRRDLRAGRYRRGLFALDDALLVHDGTTCSLIPRGRITSISHHVKRGERNRRYLGDTFAAYLDRNGDDKQLVLPFVAAPPLIGNAERRAEEAPVFLALKAWRENGWLDRPDRRQKAPPLTAVARAWLKTIFLGHLTLNVVGAATVVLATLIGGSLGKVWAMSFALIFAGAMFLVLPMIALRLFPSLAAPITPGGEDTPGFGYLIVLGFAAIILGFGGYMTSHDLYRLTTAARVSPVQVAEIDNYRGTDAFLELVDQRVLDQPQGHTTRTVRSGSGANRTTTTHHYFARPIVSRDLDPATLRSRIDRRALCLWMVYEDEPTAADSAWFIAESWDLEAHREAVAGALAGTAPGCEPVLLRNTPPPSEAVAAAWRQLGLLALLLNTVPLVLLAGWAVYRLDQPRAPSLADR